MKEYIVDITDDALADMDALYEYIATELQSPENAIDQYNRIPLSPKPVIITSAIKNIIHIYIIVSYLINNQIPLRYKHFVIKIMWKPFILYKRIPVRHCLKRPESFHDLILLFSRSVFVYSGQK